MPGIDQCTFDQHVAKNEAAHEKLHVRMDALQLAQEGLTVEIKGLRKDITPVTEVFNVVLTYWKGGKFLRKFFWGVIASILTICTLALTVKQLLG